MPRESKATKLARAAEIIGRLRQAYPEAHCELNFSNPLELLIATILSAQCTDKQVNLVTAELFRKYRSAADFAGADPEQFAQDIRRIGLFRNKAKNIQATCRMLLERHGGEVPRTLPELTALAGVGRKTANVVLGCAFGLNEGIVVDTHVGRLSARLGLSAATDPVTIEVDLIPLVPREHWALFSHLLIWHGRRRCPARSPDCAACEVAALCPGAGRG
jgi:endonuclease-3